MSIVNDLTPPKLFPCELLRRSLNITPDDRSEMCQQLYMGLSDEEKEKMPNKILGYLTKLQNGWEPSKEAILQFFCSPEPESPSSKFITQVMTEWKSRLVQSYSFIFWASEIRQWYSCQIVEGSTEAVSTLLEYTSFINSCFCNITIANYAKVEDNVSAFFTSPRYPFREIVFPQPFPAFTSLFSATQYRNWMNQFQSSLFTYQQTVDLEAIESSLLTIPPTPPFPLLALIRLLQNDVSSAHDYLLKSIPTISQSEILLLPLLYYAFVQESSKTLQLLQELRQVCRTARNDEFNWLLAYIEVFSAITAEEKLRCLENSLQECSHSKEGEGRDDNDNDNDDERRKQQSNRQIVVNALLRYLPYYPSFLTLCSSSSSSSSSSFPQCKAILSRYGLYQEHSADHSSLPRTVYGGMEWLKGKPASLGELIRIHTPRPSIRSVSIHHEESHELSFDWIQKGMKALQMGDENALLSALSNKQSSGHSSIFYHPHERGLLEACIQNGLRQQWIYQQQHQSMSSSSSSSSSSLMPWNVQYGMTSTSTSTSTRKTMGMRNGNCRLDEKETKHYPLLEAITSICNGICVAVYQQKSLPVVLVECIRDALALAISLHLPKAVQWCVFLLALHEGEEKTSGVVDQWKKLTDVIGEDEEMYCLIKEQLFKLGECSLKEYVDDCIQKQCFAHAVRTLRSLSPNGREEEQEEQELLEKVLAVQKMAIEKVRNSVN